MDKRPKMAILLSGGGMGSAYSAGALIALAKELKLDEPDIIIAGSGGAGASAYFVSKQYEAIEKIWKELLSCSDFIDFSRWKKIVDIDYLIDTVFKKQIPLDLEKINNSKTELFIPATRCIDGIIKYFPIKEHDPFELLRATKALPVLYGKTIDIDGDLYSDGISDPRVHIKKAKELGAEKIIMINNQSTRFLTELSKAIIYFWKDRTFRKNYYVYQKEVDSFKENKDIFIIKPRKRLSVDLLNNNGECLIRTYNQGYIETTKNKELRKFLEPLH